MPKLSAKLSPQAKKSALGPADLSVRALVEVSGAGPAAVERALAAAGVSELRWVRSPGLVSVTLPAGRLQALADLAQVSFVELAEGYAP
jgi:hypothetical protein